MKTFAKILLAGIIFFSVAQAFDGPPPPPCNPKLEHCFPPNISHK